jgi:hypothetical protein
VVELLEEGRHLRRVDQADSPSPSPHSSAPLR